MLHSHDYPLGLQLQRLRKWYRSQGARVDFQSFAYDADFPGLSLITGATVVNTADSDADFAICQTMVFDSSVFNFDDANQPNVQVRLTHEIAGKTAMDRDIQAVSLFGSADAPFYWVEPLIIPAGTSWATTATNIDNVTLRSPRFTFWGVKCYATPFGS